MAKILVFRNKACFRAGLKTVQSFDVSHSIINEPEFVKGLVAPALSVTCESSKLAEIEQDCMNELAGIIPYSAIKDLPHGAPPNILWQQALGNLTLISVNKSSSDPMRFRVEFETSNDLGEIIRLIPHLIRGGAYNPVIPAFTFEEDHRLIAFHGRRIVFSRLNGITDIWIMTRTAVDLAISGYKHKPNLMPLTERRQGIGVIEIYKRLPQTDCGKCDRPSCMEFSMALFSGKMDSKQCPTLNDPEFREKKVGLEWLLQLIM